MTDQKITDLAEVTIPESADLLAIVDDVVGSPATKKIEVGNVVSYGRNLIQNSAFIDSNGDDLPDFWALRLTPTLVIAPNTLFPADKGNQITITAVGATDEGIYIPPGTTNWLKILPEKTYTLTVPYKVIAGDHLRVLVISYNDAAAGTVHVDDGTLASTTATKVTYTFTTDADANNLSFNLLAKADGDIVIVSHPKLEQGAVATPYHMNHHQEEGNIIDYYHPHARAFPATDQDNITNNTWTQVVLGSEDYDVGSNFTSNQFTVPVTGIYSIAGNLTWEAAAIVNNKIYGCAIYVDPLGVGSDAAVVDDEGVSGPQNEEISFHVSDNLLLNKDDEVTLWAFHNDGTANPDIESGTTHTSLSVNLISLAN